MRMIQANIHEAKTNLSSLIEKALSGKQVVISKRNIPLVELKPVQKEKKGKRILGQAKGKIILTDEFFEPLPDDILEAFNNPK